MQLTMTGEYAVRAMMGLASVPYGTVVKIDDLSTQWIIPQNFLRKIMSALSKAGLVISQRGSGGGVRLGMPADKITLLDVVEAAEGKIFLNKCLVSPEFCHRSTFCAVHLVWGEAQEAIVQILSKRTLADVAALDTQRNEVHIASAARQQQSHSVSQECPACSAPPIQS